MRLERKKKKIIIAIIFCGKIYLKNYGYNHPTCLLSSQSFRYPIRWIRPITASFLKRLRNWLISDAAANYYFSFHFRRNFCFRRIFHFEYFLLLWVLLIFLLRFPTRDCFLAKFSFSLLLGDTLEINDRMINSAKLRFSSNWWRYKVSQ